MELVQGCQSAAKPATVQKFLRQVRQLPVTAPISRRAYGFMEAFFLSHGLQIPDALIAATARERGLTLYTKNLRHFQMISGLTVVRPY
jgi:predicted nucleic acid-binding protein